MDSDCIRFGPGTAVSLSGRDWNTCLNHCLPPFERTETVRPSALATKSSPSQSADAQTAVCPVSVFEILHWPFKQFSAIDPVFGCYGGCTNGRAVSKLSLSQWIVDAITEAYTTQGLEIPSVHWGLSFHLAWLRCMCIQDIACQPVVFAEYLRQVLQAGHSVLSLLRAVGE